MTPTRVVRIGYGPASAQDRSRFAAVAKASAGFLLTSTVTSLTVSGRDAGAVAVYRTKPGLTRSTMFQDQYIVQLVNAVTRAPSTPTFVRADGQVMALSTGRVAVAGWFQGDEVVLVYRQARTPALAALAAGVRSSRAGG
ncbi:hypothetical protein [Pedococcus sp. 5OH_020]|uniref:hypothetical protein n=1 Tax=Pedococcus sp. 5OH_020 TaxID=2989814 RepID=UPI0022E9E566|nr:hypothetical protein [Pedococcus sp. 5OH_020]